MNRFLTTWALLIVLNVVTASLTKLRTRDNKYVCFTEKGMLLVTAEIDTPNGRSKGWSTPEGVVKSYTEQVWMDHPINDPDYLNEVIRDCPYNIGQACGAPAPWAGEATRYCHSFNLNNPADVEKEKQCQRATCQDGGLCCEYRKKWSSSRCPSSHTYRNGHACVADPECPLAYCNRHQDLKNALCGGQACASDGDATRCTQHWTASGQHEPRALNMDVCQASIATKECYWDYCNAHPDLQNAFCGGNTCVSKIEAGKCAAHWFNSGKGEERQPDPEQCANEWETVVINNGDDIGPEAFNAKFRRCPVVRYRFEESTVHSVYVRTSMIPDTMNPYGYFTSEWSDTSNELGTDFELYDSLSDARSKSGKWTFCNYNDPPVGYPRDCGKDGYVAHLWFSQPGSRHGARGDSFEIYAGDDCPTTVPLSEGQCLAEAVRVHGPKVTANRQHLVAGTWYRVPLGCSVQSGGDWAAHYNRGPKQGNDGTYTVVLFSDPSWSSQCLDDKIATNEASMLNMTWPPMIHPNGDVRLNFRHQLDRDRVRVEVKDGEGGCVKNLVKDSNDPHGAHVLLSASCFSDHEPTFNLTISRSATCDDPDYTAFIGTEHVVQKRMRYDDQEHKYCYEVTVSSFALMINGLSDDSEALAEFLATQEEWIVRTNYSEPSIQVWSADSYEKSPFHTGLTTLSSYTFQTVYFAVPDCDRLKLDDQAYLFVTDIKGYAAAAYEVVGKETGWDGTSGKPMWIQSATEHDARCFVKVVFDSPQSTRGSELCVTFMIKGIGVVGAGRRLEARHESFEHTYGIRRLHGEWTDLEQIKMFALVGMLLALLLVVWKCVEVCGVRERMYAQPPWNYEMPLRFSERLMPRRAYYQNPQRTLKNF